MSDGEDYAQGEHSGEVPEDRIAHYQTLAQDLLDTYSRSFDAFTDPYPELVRLGDAKLRGAQATGYNILPDAHTMPLDSGEQHIFYNNYIGRPEHFGLLLAAMEHDGLITEADIRFGVKASKVALTGMWEPDSADEAEEDLVVSGPTTPDGSLQAHASKTVETVVTLVPHDETHAQSLIEFLLRRTKASEADAIPGSWEVPDIRATANLNNALSATGRFVLVQANIHRRTDTTAQLLILREQTQFKGPWQHRQVTVGDDLALYIASSELGVEP